VCPCSNARSMQSRIAVISAADFWTLRDRAYKNCED
jgi:hypothetical protein